LDRELDIDEELLRSPAYFAQYQALMRDKTPAARVTNQAAAPAQNIHESVLEKRDLGIRKPFLQSFTWFRSEESRKLAVLLCQAAEAGNVLWAESLLREGAYVDGFATDDDTNLHKEIHVPGWMSLNMISLSKRRAIEDWIDMRPFWSSHQVSRQTPLMSAARQGHIEVVNLLLGNGADVNAKNILGYTALRYALGQLVNRRQDTTIMTMLLRKGANPNLECADRYEDGLLAFAAKCNRIDVVKILVGSHASINLRQSTTALWCVSSRGCLDIAKFLIESGARPDLRISRRIRLDDSGSFKLENCTVIYAAAMSRGDGLNLEVLPYLLANGASATVTCSSIQLPPLFPRYRHSNVTPLHVARGRCARVLIRHGASVFARDSHGWTPLFWAIGLWGPGPDAIAVQENLTAASPVNIQDNAGQTPLQFLLARLSKGSWLSKYTLRSYLTAAKAMISAGAGYVHESLHKEAKRLRGCVLTSPAIGLVENSGTTVLGIYVGSPYLTTVDTERKSSSIRAVVN
jgi:ankyrin repeat protein